MSRLPGNWKNLTCTALVVFVLCSVQAFSQTKTWYFGDHAGVDFSTVPPTAIEGPIQTNEGCAVVTNSRGKVVFSTDGERIFDGSDNMVYSGLEGDISSTHSAIIIPHPKEPCERFFVFTVGSAEDQSINSGLHVVEVEVSSNGINVSPSRQLHRNSTEKLAATPDGNGGYWVVSHDYVDTAEAQNPQGKRFYSYHITYASVLNSINPIVTEAGGSHDGTSPFGGDYWNSVGQMKFSHDGDRLALTLYAKGVIDIFRFERSNGRLYFLTRLDQFQRDFPGTNLYGVEFSPSGNVIYASTGYANPNQYGYVWAFDLSIISASTIWNNRVEVARQLSTNDNKYPFGALQTGPDGAIYIARNGEPYIDRIGDPNNQQNPQYTSRAINLKDTCRLGLPTSIKSVDCTNGAWPCSKFSVDISVDTALCFGDSIALGFDSIPGYTYRWNTGSRRSRIYGKAGVEYAIAVTDSLGCYGTSFFTVPKAINLDTLSIPSDTILCSETRNTVSFAFPGVDYLWQDGSSYEYNFNHTESVGISFYTYCDTLNKVIRAEVHDCSCTMAVPNAFSPNNDFVNDYYELKVPCPLEYFKIQIFNRWGEKVFESNDIDYSWNGTIGSKPAKADTYIYLLEYESPLSDPVYDQGAITLIR